MTRRLTPLVSVALVCLAAPAAFAQDSATEAPPAHISFVEGAVALERDGRRDESPGSMPLLAGDRIRTQGGRAEALFADGSTLHIDNHTVVDFQSDEVLRLIEGRLRLAIAGRGRDVAYRVDAPGGWVQIAEAGEYRIAVVGGERERQVELAVLRGGAELVNEDGRSFVRAGERAFARAGSRPSPPYVFNSAAWDDFDRWSESRRDQRLGVSAQYLPPDVVPYAATFDSYGSWQHEPTYGYVWYPRVHVGWRPYYHGRWVSLRPYGLTWIGADPWGWPTHHYGRWGFSSNAWFWIPGRHWGAAWVSWAYAPGYVSWCPLGWNNRPVFSFINVNVFGGRRYDPWHAWTVVPRGHFGTGFVNVHAFAGSRLNSHVRSSFVLRDSSPAWRHAVPRASAPIRAVGTRTGYAVPRGSTAGSVSLSNEGVGIPSGTRRFPAPAREPRTPGALTSDPGGSAAITPSRDRAVPRDRSLQRNTGTPSTATATGVTTPGSASPQRRNPEAAAPGNGSPTVPPGGSRAVPRRTPDVERSQPQASETTPGVPAVRSDRGDADWGRYDRSPDRREPASPPARWSGDGSRRAPDRGTPSDGADRYRAVPRQDAPRSSYEAPRAAPPRSYESPRSAPERSYEAPRSAPDRSYASPRSAPDRSYGSPRGESRPSSPSADRPARSAPGGESGSRPRGGQPSQGQASRRPSGGSR